MQIDITFSFQNIRTLIYIMKIDVKFMLWRHLQSNALRKFIVQCWCLTRYRGNLKFHLRYGGGNVLIVDVTEISDEVNLRYFICRCSIGKSIDQKMMTVFTHPHFNSVYVYRICISNFFVNKYFSFKLRGYFKFINLKLVAYGRRKEWDKFFLTIRNVIV